MPDISYANDFFSLLGKIIGALTAISGVLWAVHKMYLSSVYQTKRDSKEFEKETEKNFNKHADELKEIRTKNEVFQAQYKGDMDLVKLHLSNFSKHHEKLEKMSETMLHKINNVLSVDIQKTVKYLIDEDKNQK